MFRQTETNLKWMLTISFLFHLTILSLIFSSGIFKRSDLFSMRSSPLNAIQVNLVGSPQESRQAASPPVPSSSMPQAEKKVSEIKPVAKIEKLREVKDVSAKKQEDPASARQIAESGSTESKSTENRSEGNQTSAGSSSVSQEAKLATGGAMVSGPAVDMPSFKYDYYLGLIKNKVDSRWNQPVNYSKARMALIEFTINRKGEISNVRITEPSGDRYFDQTALRAVTLATPFPPLPRGFKGDTLKVHYRFIFGEKS